MNVKTSFLGITILSVLLTAACVLPARADIVLSIEPVTVPTGSSGTFDVLLTNTGPQTQNIDSFNFTLSTPNPNVTFTDVTTATATAPYIFPDSLFGPDITTTAVAQNVSAGDVEASGTGTDVAAGSTYGLGLVSFTVDGGAAPGDTVSIHFEGYPATSLSDLAGNNVDFTSVDGTIVVTANVPEPSALVTVTLGLGLLVLSLRKKRRNYLALRAPLAR